MFNTQIDRIIRSRCTADAKPLPLGHFYVICFVEIHIVIGSLRIAKVLPVAILIAWTFHFSPGRAAIVFPGDGLFFSQIDLAYTHVTQSDSAYGMAAVDVHAITTATGISSGFLNIITDAGWVVRNMPIDPAGGYPGISAMFDLGVTPGVAVQAIQVLADFSAAPVVSFGGANSTTYAVGEVTHNAEGKGSLRTESPTNSIDASVISFQSGAATTANWQPGHPSIEQDNGQCGPAAVANSLQWLEDKYGIQIPHPYGAGLGDNNDGTLVGELDQDMGRSKGVGVPDHRFMEGKLEYLSDNNLGNNGPGKRIVTKHLGGAAIPGDFTHMGLTSRIDTSGLTLMEWIQQEIAHGEDVELSVLWDGGGGHWVELIGAGQTLGTPWLAWRHDAFQGNIGGTSWFDGGIGWSPVINNQLILFIEGKFRAATLDLTVSQSPVPEPSSLTILALGTAGAALRKHRRNKLGWGASRVP